MQRFIDFSLYLLKKSQRMFILFQGLYYQRNFYIFFWIAAIVLRWTKFNIFCSFFFFFNFALSTFHLLLCSMNFIPIPFCLCSGSTLNRVCFWCSSLYLFMCFRSSDLLKKNHVASWFICHTIAFTFYCFPWPHEKHVLTFP